MNEVKPPQHDGTPRSHLVLAQQLVIFPGLVFFISEIFHTFIVHERVDGVAADGRVGGVHALPDGDPRRAVFDREKDVGSDGR